MIRFLTVFLSVFVLVGCSGQKSNKSNAGFEPNPIVLEKLQVTTLPTGAEMPIFELPDMNGQSVSSNDYKDAKILLIAFISNHCPTAQAYEDRLIDFTKEYKDKGVQVVPMPKM